MDKDGDGVVWYDGEDTTNPNSEVTQEAHYYPFGLAMTGAWTPAQTPKDHHGYNGIENFASSGINLSFAMFRTLDPVLGRWLQVDPEASSAFSHTPYNSMFNNPISMSDPNGDFPLAAALLVNAAVAVFGNGIGNTFNNRSFFEGWAGAAVGGLMSSNPGQAFLGALSSHLPGIGITMGPITIGLSPSIFFGSTGFGVGANLSISVNIGEFTIGWTAGLSYGSNSITGKKGWNGRVGGGVSYEGKDGTYLSFSTMAYGSGASSQRTGTWGVGYGGVKLHYENDDHPYFGKFPLGDKGDRYRTTGVSVSYEEYSIGFNLFTGDPGRFMGDRKFAEDSSTGRDTYIGGNANKYRLGAVYGSIGNARFGYTSEGIRHYLQNIVAHDKLTKGKAKWFKSMPSVGPSGYYGGFYSKNPYSTWEW